jgi:uroporphyrinogen-III synthase
LRIVLTRPEGRGEAAARALRAEGHEVLLVPLTEIRAVGEFPDPAGFDSVLFTSAAAAERAPPGARWPRVGAVGERTAAALRDRGIRVDIVGEGGGAALAQAFAPRRGERILLPRAREAHPALEEALAAMGAEVTAAAVYENVPRREVDRAALAAAEEIWFFAGSAVRAFRALRLDTRARLVPKSASARDALDSPP